MLFACFYTMNMQHVCIILNTHVTLCCTCAIKECACKSPIQGSALVPFCMIGTSKFMAFFYSTAWLCTYVGKGVLIKNSWKDRYYTYVYHIIERSIADISALRRHIHRGANRQGKYAAEVRYRGYMDLPIIHIVYMIYCMVSAQLTNLFAWDGRIFSKRRAIFHSEVDMPYNEPHCNT